MKDQLTTDNLLGKKVGRLHILALAGKSKSYHKLVKCKCDCGAETIKRLDAIRSGMTRSCGCLQRDVARKGKLTHGDSLKRLYNIWKHIKNRCLNPKNDNYRNYGGRGIGICDRWNESYENFKDDMNDLYSKHIKEFGNANTTIERLDNNKGYYPGNCVFATKAEQSRNQRIKSNQRKFKAVRVSDGVVETHNSQTKFARKHNISRRNMFNILKLRPGCKTAKGWTFSWVDE